MRVLVLGASGMLGHKLLQRLAGRFDVAGTVRGAPRDYAGLEALRGFELIGGVSAESSETVGAAIDAWGPDAVVNCVGTIKQRPEAKDPVTSITVNSLFPHRVAAACGSRGARLVHFSTDCVFSGRTGAYTEADTPDATDLYGRSKLLGEVTGPGSLTLRTSIIGHELRDGSGLLEWFLSQAGGRVKGFANAIFSGFPTVVLADLVADLLRDEPRLEGLWHVSSDPISKFDLLALVNDAYDLGVTIERDEDFHCNRHLLSEAFRSRTGFTPRPWKTLIGEMRADAGQRSPA